MELKDYTTEELKQELKRRNKENKKSEQSMVKSENHWILFQGEIISVSSKGFKYRVDSDTLAMCGYSWLNKSRSFGLVASLFAGKDKPQIGDIVEMRARKYASGIIGYTESKITKIVTKCVKK